MQTLVVKDFSMNSNKRIAFKCKLVSKEMDCLDYVVRLRLVIMYHQQVIVYLKTDKWICLIINIPRILKQVRINVYLFVMQTLVVMDFSMTTFFLTALNIFLQMVSKEMDLLNILVRLRLTKVLMEIYLAISFLALVLQIVCGEHNCKKVSKQ